MTTEKPKWVRSTVRAAVQFAFTALWLYLAFFSGARGLWFEAVKLVVFIVWAVNLAGWMNDIRYDRAATDKR